MKKNILFLVFFLLAGMSADLFAQTSPDYIFGNDNGSGWNWTTGTAGTAGLGSTYKWQFLSTATEANHYFKFAETSSPDDGQGFWMNNAAGDLEYTGNGTMWNVYYYANMGANGAIYFANTAGNYYVVKTRKDPSNSNCNFAIFNNGTTAPVTISAVSRTFSAPNLLINVTLSGVKSADEKVWVRYTTNNWTSSSTVEASLNTSGNIWQASVALADGEMIKYYAFTTIQQAVAPAEADADFYTVNYNNNSGVNYTYMNGSMSGTYYIGNNGTRPGGGNPDFGFLAQACDALNSSTISGDINIYFTSDVTEQLNSGLGVNTNTFKITFKPSADEDRTITFMKTTDNAGPSGGFAIGISNILDWSTLVQTDNVTIDGYADGGSTRRLIWKSDASAHYYTGPLSVVGNSNNIQIKNLKVQHDAVLSLAGNNTAAIAIRLRYTNPTSYIPDNITIENCEINVTSQTAGNGIYLINSNTPSPIVYMTGIVIKNNIIRARHRGIFINYVNGLQVEGNEIYVNQTGNGMASIGLGGNTNVTGTINVIGNKLLQNGTMNTSAGAYGIRAIQCSGGTSGTWYVINNFITGFSTAATGTAEVVGIRVGVPTYIYNNSIIIDNVSTTGPGTTPTCGIVAYTTSTYIQNNIIITNEDNFANYCIYAASLPNTSDYNNLYRSGTSNAKIGYYTSARATLDDWKTGSGKDANSLSANVTFLSATDLHIDPSNWVPKGQGIPIASVTTDIDGNSRSTSIANGPVCIGADEYTPTGNAGTTVDNPNPGDGITQTFTGVDGKKVCTITWTDLGGPIEAATFPTSITMTYTPGKRPVDNSGNPIIDRGIDRMFTITPDVAGSEWSATVRLYYNASTELRGFTEANMRVNRRPNSGNGLWDVVPSTINTTDHYAEFTATSFSTFGIDDGNSPLPVELVGFTALSAGKEVNLNWSTKTEVNSYQFIVERKVSDNWEAIGEVAASGNSNSPKEYTFTDKHLANGKYSYRLKIVDTDGTFEYSNAIEVDIEVVSEYTLHQNYPNPFNPTTTISYQLPVDSKVRLEIFSITGELIGTLVDNYQTSGTYNVQLSTNNFNMASGTYIYRLTANDYVSVKKLVVLK